MTTGGSIDYPIMSDGFHQGAIYCYSLAMAAASFSIIGRGGSGSPVDNRPLMDSFDNFFGFI